MSLTGAKVEGATKEFEPDVDVPAAFRGGPSAFDGLVAMLGSMGCHLNVLSPDTLDLLRNFMTKKLIGFSGLPLLGYRGGGRSPS
jgi:hypothetical protein